MKRRHARPSPQTLAGGDATKTVYVRYLDGAGNASRSFMDTIALDITGPVVGAISATPDPFAPRSGQTATIRIPVSDNLSGLCALQIRILDVAGGDDGRVRPTCARDRAYPERRCEACGVVEGLLRHRRCPVGPIDEGPSGRSALCSSSSLARPASRLRTTARTPRRSRI